MESGPAWAGTRSSAQKKMRTAVVMRAREAMHMLERRERERGGGGGGGGWVV